MQVSPKYGWYGKIPCRGDFLREDLSLGFITAWDTWMQQLLLSGQTGLREGWQRAYLGAPIWRFALSPGTCGPKGAAGIFMPSVDKVGRQFPLCIATETDVDAATSHLASTPVWVQLEQIALSMLDDGASPAKLASALLGVSVPRMTREHVARQVGDGIALQGRDGTLPLLAAQPPRHAASIWSCQHMGTDRLLLFPELPRGAESAIALFDIDAPLWSPADDQHPD